MEELQPGARPESHTAVSGDVHPAECSAAQRWSYRAELGNNGGGQKKAAKFDLTLSIVDKEEGLDGSLEYNSDLFEEETIERMLGHYQILLEGVVANRERPISRLPLLTEAERQQLLVEWNATGSGISQGQMYSSAV